MGTYRSAAGVASGDREPTLPLRRVPMTGKLVGFITTHQIHELWTHYHKGHTVGCTRPNDPTVAYETGMCPGCDARCSLKYEAYCGFFNPATKNHVILALPVGAVRQVIDQLGSLTGIRGVQLDVGRAKPIMNSRVLVKTGMQMTDRTGLPAPFDVIAHLQRIWGVEHRQTIADSQKPESREVGECPQHDYSEFRLERDIARAKEKDCGNDPIDDQLQFPG